MQSQVSRVRAYVSLVSDVATTIVAFYAAIGLRYSLGGWSVDASVYGVLLGLILVLWIFVLRMTGCYERTRSYSFREISLRILSGLLLAHLALSLVLFYAQAVFISRGFTAIFFIVNYVMILLGRLVARRFLRGQIQRRTIVLGTGPQAREFAETLRREEGHEIIGFVRGPSEQAGAESLGGTEDIKRLVTEHSPIDELAVALSVDQWPQIRAAVRECEDRGISVRQVLFGLGSDQKVFHLERVGQFSLLTARPGTATELGLVVKRAMDIGVSLIGLLITATIFPFVALAIKLTSKGPVLFGQDRVGLNGRVFKIYKFRTMAAGAHEMRSELAHLNEATGPHFKIKKDPRVTSVGRWLRRMSMDELPQFWGVFVGHMSVVGPRPFPREEVHDKENSHIRRLSIKPGITGIWQTSGRSEVNDFERIVEMDEFYIRNWSIWLDIKILLKTIPAVLRGSGAV